MGKCTFKCNKGNGLYCCDCGSQLTYAQCTENKCDMACTTVDKQDLEDTNGYYEEYVKPQK